MPVKSRAELLQGSERPRLRTTARLQPTCLPAHRLTQKRSMVITTATIWSGTPLQTEGHFAYWFHKVLRCRSMRNERTPPNQGNKWLARRARVQAMQWRPDCTCSREDVGWQAIGPTDLQHAKEPTRLLTQAQPSMQLRCCALGGAVHCATVYVHNTLPLPHCRLQGPAAWGRHQCSLAR